MEIHTNTLTESDIRAAGRQAGVAFVRLAEKGSRSYARKFDVILTGSGGWANSGTFGGNSEHQAATWDEWGIFLNAVFTADPDAYTRAYDGVDHFRWATTARFDDLDSAEQHKRHRWTYTGTSASGTYAAHDCKCGAQQRVMVRGTFADIA